MEVSGKLVLVTGASQGIGAACSRLLARHGARVLLVARTESKLRAVAGEIEAAGGEAHVFPCDLSDPAAVTELGDAILAQLGAPDVIVNNAGAGRWLAVDETPIEEAVQMIQAPYLAAFFVTRVFLPAMLERDSGVIVNVQSPISRATSGGCTGYAASRWALRGFTLGLRGDLRGTGLSVVEAMFGEVSSNYWENNPGANERLPGIARALIPEISPVQAAAGVLAAIRSERALVCRPFMMRVTVVLLRWFPRLVQWLTVATGWQRPR